VVGKLVAVVDKLVETMRKLAAVAMRLGSWRNRWRWWIRLGKLVDKVGGSNGEAGCGGGYGWGSW
jgi:hypothetical protein